MATAWHDWLSAWEELPHRSRRIPQARRERVLVLKPSGRGKTSGLDVGQRPKRAGANLLHVRDGKVTRHVLYWNRERALADLGISE